MRAFGYLSLLGSLLFAAVSSQQTSDLSRRDERLQQFYNHMAKDGTCLIYIDTFATNDGLTPCGIFCKANGQPEDKIGCHSEHIYDPEGSYPKDPDGWEWYPGKCICAEQIDPIAEAIAIPVIEALAKLDEIICGVFVQAIVESINIGFALVPGAGQAAASARAATKAAVEGAKSFAENSMNPTDFFDGWVKKSCGMDKIELDYDNTFDSLVNAPDSVGTSKGCKRKNKGDCRTLDAKPDPPTTTKKDDAPETTKREEAPETTKKDDGPKSTKKDEVRTTTRTEAGPTTTATRSSTSSANPRGTPVNCQSCRSSKAKKAAREARWGSMFVPRASGDSCLLDSSKHDGSCTASGLQARDSLLSERKQPEPPHLVVNGRPFWIKYGKHKSCSEAIEQGTIDRFYYFEGDAKCGGDLKYGTKKDVGDLEFENDHVYEKQTLALFLEWLGDGDMTPIGGGSTKPQASWVAEVLLDEDGPRVFKMQHSNNRPLGIPVGGAPLDDVLAYGIARSDTLRERNGAGMPVEKTTKNFALVAAKVNQHKGTFFGQNRPNYLTDTHPKAANKNRNWIRNHAGVFHYLKYTHSPPSKKENVWNKWMRVSNWVDLVLSEFDQSYVWGYHPDEPHDAADGPSSLRSFYAHWIDMYLAGIEKNAQDWAVGAKSQFELSYGNDNEAAAKQWMAKAFDTNGFATAARMTFPRPGSGPSVYGAYGNPVMTLDSTGEEVVLAPPAPL
ncbi:hypothetical protein CH35J_007896 [Colletotrichum higginsianum]|uniref:Uncharacterized protein n=1 Tax=Colletotrichum higginsianum TaxID=80884 RepID=A0A4T0VTP3_9PEZI|nr:hypothetical protein CH35J_007896 [Colletotrichum higginsianum]